MPDVRKTLTDAGYIAIGLGVMGFQQAQERRRELQGRLESATSHLGDAAQSATTQISEAAQSATNQLSEAARDGKRRFEGLAGDIGQRVEPILERVDGTIADLPDPLNRAVEPVYTKIRELVGSAA
ncbi:MAG: hypothetical protein JWL83_2887 [Actinomycetia bacterium]|jgi:hypothetical protein|nr:hypothetical protein [Actinomycetes bacterium]